MLKRRTLFIVILVAIVVVVAGYVLMKNNEIGTGITDSPSSVVSTSTSQTNGVVTASVVTQGNKQIFTTNEYSFVIPEGWEVVYGRSWELYGNFYLKQTGQDSEMGPIYISTSRGNGRFDGTQAEFDEEMSRADFSETPVIGTTSGEYEKKNIRVDGMASILVRNIGYGGESPSFAAFGANIWTRRNSKNYYLGWFAHEDQRSNIEEAFATVLSTWEFK